MSSSRPPKGADLRTFEAARSALEDGAPPARFLELAEGGKAAAKAVEAALSAESARPLLERMAREAGLPEDLADAPGKLLRRARGREEAARTRLNPIARNEGFPCGHCGLDVPPAPGSAVRNHCPACLRSLHVDGPVPGDRASTCGGLMDPVSAELAEGRWRVRQRCRRCGHERVAALHLDWADEPDRAEALRALTAKGGPGA